MDYSPNGNQFATAGKDFNIRIYDEGTKSVDVTLAAAEWNSRGHSNRVFAVKFIDENTLISGGWDSVIHIWDIRQAASVRSIYGPHLSGDALDFQNGQILTGSYSSKDQIQLWDFDSGKLIETLDWSTNK
jgi:COMPASS component SWD3